MQSTAPRAPRFRRRAGLKEEHKMNPDRNIDILRQGFMRRVKKQTSQKSTYKALAWCERCHDWHAGIAKDTRRGPEIIKCDK